MALEANMASFISGLALFWCTQNGGVDACYTIEVDGWGVTFNFILGRFSIWEPKTLSAQAEKI